jgi:hypothetical protein
MLVCPAVRFMLVTHASRWGGNNYVVTTRKAFIPKWQGCSYRNNSRYDLVYDLETFIRGETA